MSKIKAFLLYCSGADTTILEKCPTDENKFIGIGGTVLFTGLLAFFSAGYAVYTVFDNYFFAFVFGLRNNPARTALAQTTLTFEGEMV